MDLTIPVGEKVLLGTISSSDAHNVYFQIERQLARIHARNFDEIEGETNNEWCKLNGDWQSRVSSYISYIRTAVNNALISERLRERILARLNTLQEEVDRNRTRLASITETWLAVTEAIAKGAKNLEPAVRLLGKIGGAFSSVRTARLEDDEPPLLPAPESLGMSYPENSTE